MNWQVLFQELQFKYNLRSSTNEEFICLLMTIKLMLLFLPSE